jgi:carbamoyltransferase
MGRWKTPYLGNEILGDYPTKSLLAWLTKSLIVGVANGKAEFGPRALGNRSLLADPQGPSIKDRVNRIKKRQEFRPFAPVIMEEFAHDYFQFPDGVQTSPYMQYVAHCLNPDAFPAIVHADGTSRVQTVNAAQHPALYDLLAQFYESTGCPMLLNTSLNIRGRPMVDNETDAQEFENTYGVKVFTRE